MRIYPVFMPHQGCPFQCVYCNQHVVTSSGFKGFVAGSLVSLLGGRLAQVADDARRAGVPGELAFYGGTFTALPLETISALLDGVLPWVREGVFTGIRFSTRPDGMTTDVCTLLKDYPLRTVELGVQSLSDKVLTESRRGYSVETVREAASRVHEGGWSLGLQLMPGLPGDTTERFSESILGSISLAPSFVRLYPTLVLEGTLLAEWHRRGIYRPLSLEEAIQWCVPAYDAFLRAGISVARMGLHADPELEKPGRIIAGPYHPSFGYLVRVRWWRERVDRYLSSQTKLNGMGRRILRVCRRSVSEVVGPGRSNISHWKEKWGLEGLRIEPEAEWPLDRFECLPEPA